MTTPVGPLAARAAYPIKEARQLLGNLSQAKFYELIRRGDLRTFQVGRRRLVAAEAIAEFIKAAERQTDAA